MEEYFKNSELISCHKKVESDFVGYQLPVPKTSMQKWRTFFSYSDLYLENVVLFTTVLWVEGSKAAESTWQNWFAGVKYCHVFKESELPALEKQRSPEHIVLEGGWFLISTEGGRMAASGTSGLVWAFFFFLKTISVTTCSSAYTSYLKILMLMTEFFCYNLCLT